MEHLFLIPMLILVLTLANLWVEDLRNPPYDPLIDHYPRRGS